jgi:TPR repeat protein
MRRFLISLVALTAVLGAMASASAQDLSDEGSAYGGAEPAVDLGDFAGSLAQFRKAAIQGDVNAQLSLGVIYENGQGVLQDYIAAHMWMNIAAANGSTEAARNRHFVAREMTLSDISEAQRRAKICMESLYKNCN